MSKTTKADGNEALRRAAENRQQQISARAELEVLKSLKDDTEIQSVATPIAVALKQRLVIPAVRGSQGAAIQTPEQIAAAQLKRQAACQQEQRQRVATERQNKLKCLREEIGAKYLDKELSQAVFYGPDCDQDKQRAAFCKVQAFSDAMQANVRGGKNLVLVGARGTGKDFCLANLMKIAILQHGGSVKWMDGSRLFLELRDTMRPHSETTEMQYVKRLSAGEILAISDPMPPSGNLTEFQAGALLSIIDFRYRRDLPTWLTLNASCRKDAEARMGALIVDRLFENADVIHFDWPSFRKWQRDQTQ